MSHIVTIQTRLYDQAALAAACVRLNLPPPTSGRVQLYGGEVEGLVVQLPDWRYPVVIHPSAGTAKFDNFEGAWGDMRHLHRLLQIYAAEKTKIEARKKGYSVTEQSLEDGRIKLEIVEPT